MKQPVVIKGNAYGLQVILDEEIPFPQLLKLVGEKFSEASKFFRNAKLGISFEGRKLSGEEEEALIDVITEHSTITVLCILDRDRDRELETKRKVEAAKTTPESGTGQFYKGTLRSGQVVESESSIIILGDVNPGAKVIAKGNVVVLGALKGTAYAGISGDSHAFVAALSMNPLQIRIGDYIARSSDKPENKKSSDIPKIAFIEDGNIYIEPISKEVIHDINFM